MSQTPVTFDPKKPVYVIKQFFYGNANSSIRPASDHPLRLDQIPSKYRTSEHIKQGRVRSNIPTMIKSEESGGITIDSEAETKEVGDNPLEIKKVVDKKGEPLPASTPMSTRKAAARKAKSEKTG